MEKPSSVETQDNGLQLLKNFQEDSKWFHENTESLRSKGLTGNFVAIKNKKVLSSDKSADQLIELLDKQGENPSFIFIEFVYPQGHILIL